MPPVTVLHYIVALGGTPGESVSTVSTVTVLHSSTTMPPVTVLHYIVALGGTPGESVSTVSTVTVPLKANLLAQQFINMMTAIQPQARSSQLS